MIRITRSGWGDVPADVRHPAISQSAILEWMNCEQAGSNRYLLNRELDRPPGPALSEGTAWHYALELLARGASVDEAIVKSDDNITQAAFEAEAGGFDDHAKRLRRFATYIENALPVYVEKYGQQGPTGRTIYAEQPFWIEVAFSGFNAVLRGKPDKIGEIDGRLVNGEVKTVGTGSDIPAWLTHRKGSVQDVLYCGAVQHIENREVSGTVYDIAVRADWPLKASKNGSVEERREAWKNELFHTHSFAFSWDRFVERMNEIEPVLYDMVAGRSVPRRNRRACMDFNRKSCQYFASCWEGVPLDSTLFRDRADHYDKGEQDA